jgi:hypothetical protein
LLGKLNALTVFAAWACIALLVIALAYLKLTAPPGSSISPLVVLLSCFIVLIVAHVVMSWFVRCPHCNKQLTTQGFAKPRYGDWAGATTKWFSGTVVCIHCGGRVATRG